MQFSNHIEQTQNGNDITVECRACKSRGIVDVSVINADSSLKFHQSEVKRIERKHKGCAEQWARIQTETKATESQNLMVALLNGKKDFTKAYKQMFGESDAILRAESKARREIHLNNSIRFDNDVLTFVSRYSGKRRFVTKDGCDSSCDCKGSKNSYHYQLYKLLAETNVVSAEFGRQKTVEIREAA